MNNTENVFQDFKLDVLSFELVRDKSGEFLDKILKEYLPEEMQLKLQNGTLSFDDVKKIKGLLEDGKIPVKSSFLDKVKALINKDSQITIPQKNQVQKTLSKSSSLNGNCPTPPISPELLNVVSALSVAVIVYEFSNALNDIAGKLDELRRSQINDQKAKCIAALDTYKILGKSLSKREERNLILQCYSSFNEGITQLHVSIDELAKKICTMPANDWDTVIQTLKHLSSKKAVENDNIIIEFINSLLFYDAMIACSDLLLVKIGASEDQRKESHEKFEALCSRIFSEDLMERINYISQDLPEIKDQITDVINLSLILNK